MMTISIPKNKIAQEAFPKEIEELYIRLTNNLLEYAKLLTKKSTNNQKIEMILLKQSSSDIGGQSEEFLLNLELNRQKAMIEATNLSNSMNKLLAELKEVLKELREKPTSIELPHNIDSSTLEEINLIEAYLKLRKKSYEVIEYIGAFFVKEEVPKNKIDRDVFSIAILALKQFNLDKMLKNPNQDLNTLMGIILEYLTTKIIDRKKLKELCESANLEEYQGLLERLNDCNSLSGIGIAIN